MIGKVQTLAALVAGACLACGGDGGARRPNVLLITVDTLRADRLGSYGYERDTSPSLDTWMTKAVRFEDAQASSSWTLASLATLFTALPSSTHGCWNYKSSLDASFVTLAEILGDAGYETAAVPSHVFLGKKYGLHQGFAEFDDELVLAGTVKSHEAVSSPGVTAKGTAFLEERATGEGGPPFFLWLHYFDPHSDFLAHAGVSEQFGEETTEDLYDGEIAFTDKHIGRVLRALERLDLAEDTLVVFAADHGEEWRDHGRLGHGHTLFDELTRVPLAIRAPGIEPRVVSETVGLVDVLPTLLELVDVPLRHDVFGRSLVPLLEGRELEPVPVLAELDLRPKSRARSLVDGPWKLVADLSNLRLMLFDRSRDPGELDDLAGRRPEVVERLSDALDAAVERALLAAREYETAGELQLDAAELEAIDDLGYLDEPGDDGDVDDGGR